MDKYKNPKYEVYMQTSSSVIMSCTFFINVTIHYMNKDTTRQLYEHPVHIVASE
jgi:hypothetical protein